MRAVVDLEKCAKCNICVSYHEECIKEGRDGQPIIQDNCNGCGKCLEDCPAKAIALVNKIASDNLC